MDRGDERATWHPLTATFKIAKDFCVGSDMRRRSQFASARDVCCAIPALKSGRRRGCTALAIHWGDPTKNLRLATTTTPLLCPMPSLPNCRNQKAGKTPTRTGRSRPNSSARNRHTSPTSRSISAAGPVSTTTSFVCCAPALALRQQLEHLQPEFIVVHDIGGQSSRKLLAAVAAAVVEAFSVCRSAVRGAATNWPTSDSSNTNGRQNGFWSLFERI